MGDGFLRCKPPVPSMILNKKWVMLTIGLFGILLSFSIIIGKSKQVVKEETNSSIKPYPSNSISSLPSNYSEIKVTPLPTINYETKNDLSYDLELKKYLIKVKEEKLKRAQSARLSSINFQGINISQYNNNGAMVKNDEALSNTDKMLNPRDEDNRQDEKLEFLRSKNNEQVVLQKRINSLKSSYQLMAGSIISGVLINGINSDLPGEILGQISQNVFDTVKGSYLLIPQGTKVVGKYDSRIVYGQERVLVVWERLIFPNGKSISLEGMAGVDLSGYAGLSDKVDNHYLKLLTGVIFSSLLSAGAQVADGRNFNSIDPRYDELAVQGISRNINQVGQEITRKNLNVQPTIKVRPGARFNVFVNKDLILEQYKE